MSDCCVKSSCERALSAERNIVTIMCVIDFCLQVIYHVCQTHVITVLIPQDGGKL